MRSLVRWSFPFVLCAPLFLAASGALAATANVTIQNFAFTPATVQIAAGDAVAWRNLDAAPHSVHWTSGGLADSLVLTTGQGHAQAFGSPETYTYICGIHGPSMSGTVVVVASPIPTAAPTLPPRSSPPLPTTTPATPSPSASSSPTPSATPPSASPSASPRPTASATPSLTSSPLAAPASQANTFIGMALVIVGVAILGGALWWRFGGPG